MRTHKKFVVESLGCRTNQYEAQAIATQLESFGYIRAHSDEEADLCIINTCAVTASAESSSRHEIRAIAKRHPAAQIVVTGCLAERDPNLASSIPEIDAVVSNKDKSLLVQKIAELPEVIPFCIHRFEGHTRAFIKIQDGCNCFCSYCIVPYLRGRSCSRGKEEILEEAQRVIDAGHKEIVLVGVNIGDYGSGAPYRLAHLVRDISHLKGLLRLRLSSINPNQVDDALLSTMAENSVVCPSLHIVLQSGSDAVLKMMNRQYTKQQFLDIVDRVRTYIPECALTTDVIVGFPGETDTDFTETAEVIKAIQCAKIHVFPYSERPGTRAVSFTNKVTPAAIRHRKSVLGDVANTAAEQFRQRFVGRKMWVLTEGQEASCTTGLLHNGLQVLVNKIVPPNTHLCVRIKESADFLIGEVDAI